MPFLTEKTIAPEIKEENGKMTSKPGISVESILNYCKAFNAKNYALQHSFYHDEVQLILPEDRIPVLKGSPGIMNHYQPLHQDFDEVLVPIDVLVNDRHIFFLMETQFRARRRVVNGVSGFNYEPGDMARVTVWALYEVEDSLMKTIRCNMWKEEFFGQKFSWEERIQESQTRAAPGMII